MSEELKPCPWCGPSGQMDEDEALGMFFCANCGMGMQYEDERLRASAVERWNTRPVEDALRAEIAQLRAEVREWLCTECNTVYPGPPQDGVFCVICPRCGGETMPRQRAELAKLASSARRAANLARDLARSAIWPWDIYELRAELTAAHDKIACLREEYGDANDRLGELTDELAAAQNDLTAAWDNNMLTFRDGFRAGYEYAGAGGSEPDTAGESLAHAWLAEQQPADLAAAISAPGSSLTCKGDVKPPCQPPNP